MITLVTILAAIAFLVGACLTLSGLAASMSDAPSVYGWDGRSFIVGAVMFGLGAGWLIVMLIRTLLAWNWG